MENFDLEKLERKNIYKTPDDFFQNMQAKVLEQTVKQAPVVHLVQPAKVRKSNYSWWYAAAASVILLFGLMFWFNNNTNQTANEQPLAASSVEKSTIAQPIVAAQPLETAPVTTTVQPKNSGDLTIAQNYNQTYSSRESKTADTRISTNTKRTATAIKASATKNSDSQIADEILKSMSNDEIADLAKNTESDVYLDLY